MRELRGRVAVVTGAGSGIGRAVSVLLAQQGCHVALADVNRAGLEESAAQVRAHGVSASVHEVDVASRERMQSFADDVLREHGRVNILINNAGVSVNGFFK